MVDAQTVSQDQLLTLTQAAARLPHRPHSSCLWRWCRKGVLARSGERVRLRHVRIGGKIFTAQPWLTEFGQALATADASHFEQCDLEPTGRRHVLPTQQKRMEQIDDARQALAAVGI